MKVLIVGGGGREHALAWAAAKSPRVEKLYCAPGNAGISSVAECVPIGPMEFDRLVAFAKEKKIDLIVSNAGCDLLRTASLSFQEAVNVEPRGFGHQFSGHGGGTDVVLCKNAAIGDAELNHQFFFPVVCKNRNVHRCNLRYSKISVKLIQSNLFPRQTQGNVAEGSPAP